jgi:Ca-activated chloride channel family protein
VSFAAPLVLLALVLIPGLAAGYAGRQRRRRRAAAEFAAPALTASVTPRRPGLRRHVPPLLLALALAALIVAIARPQRSVAVPLRGAAFMLANDVSNSMTATDVRPTRLRAAQAAASKFVSALPASALVGQMAFARHPEVLQSPTTDHALDQAAIRSLAPGGGGTAIGATITTAVKILSGLRAAGDRRTPGAIVLLSDGGSNVGASPVAAARQARAAHIPIETIALGTSRGTITERRHGRTVTGRVPVSTRLLAAVAAASGGRAYSSVNAAGAKAIYTHLAATLGHHRVTRDLDVSFAGGALALIVAAGGLSLAWFGRLI